MRLVRPTFPLAAAMPEAREHGVTDMKGIALSYMKLDRDELETYAVFNNGHRVGEVYFQRRGYYVHSLGRIKAWKTRELAALDLLKQLKELS